MSGITRVSIDVLKIHPRNQEFFDDISGEDYIQFKDSIAEDGIISEIIVSPDMVILSGHQRYKAACELGFDTVPIRIREDISSEEQKLKLLLAANFGRKSNSKSKQRKIADEYVRLCGYKPNGDRSTEGQNGPRLTLKEIATQLGTNERSLKRSLRIERNLTESMKQLLDEGVISETLAADVIAGMSEDEQLQFISKLDITKKYTARELAPYIKKVKQLEENSSIDKDDKEDSPRDETKVESKKGSKDDPSMVKKYEDLQEKYNKEVSDYQTKIDTMEIELEALRRSADSITTNYKDGDEIFNFCNECNSFLNKVVSLRYGDSFRNMKAEDRPLPLNALANSCGKIIDALEELVKSIQTEDVIDIY